MTNFLDFNDWSPKTQGQGNLFGSYNSGGGNPFGSFNTGTSSSGSNPFFSFNTGLDAVSSSLANQQRQTAVSADGTSSVTGKPSGKVAPVGVPQAGVAPVDVTGSSQHRALIDTYAKQLAHEYGLDPEELANAGQALVEIESHGKPDATSVAGAQGLMQVMPFHFATGENPLDPDTNVRRGLTLFAQMVRDTGSYERAAAKYFGAYDLNMGAPTNTPDANGQTGVGYVYAFRNAHGAVKAARAAAQPQPTYDPLSGAQLTPSIGPPLSPTPAAGPHDYTPDQMQISGSGNSGCGPAAAIAVAAAHGQNVDPAKVVQKASTLGLWDATNGMHGPQAEQELLRQMGMPTWLTPQADEAMIQQHMDGGHPVIVSTTAHYYVLNGYNPQTGQYFVGRSGTAWAGGGQWMTLAEMNRLGQGINGVLYST